MFRFVTAIVALSFVATACVPKTQYEDREAELQETKQELRQVKADAAQCDPDTYMELKEQSQSLDILTQELVDRNTELAEEVSRLRAYEIQVKSGNLDCNERVKGVTEDYEQRLARTRATYEDLVNELRTKHESLEKELSALRRQNSDTSPKKSKPKPKKKAPAPKSKNQNQ